MEAEELGRATSGRAVRAPAPDGLDRASPEEDALQVRRGHLVAEGGLVHIPELGERERLGSERKPDVRVRELAVQPLAAREHDRPVVERRVGLRVDRVPARIARDVRVDSLGDEPEICGRELPAVGMALRLAPRSELLEVRDLPHVHLRGQVPEDRALECLAGNEGAAGQ